MAASGPYGAVISGPVFHDIHISGNARVLLGNITSDNISDRDTLIKSLAFNELDNRCNNIDPALRHTCDWFFEHEAYQTWQNAQPQQELATFLWIRGKPGSGKSTITKRAYLKAKRQHAEARNSSSGALVVGFFFNSRGGFLEYSATGFFMSILHQLLTLTDFESPRLLMEIQRKRKFMTAGWTWTDNELKEMFSEFVSQANIPITIYIDALDECEGRSSRPLIDFLCGDISGSRDGCPRLKLCVSSRHYPNIHVPNCSTITVEDFNASDINMYVETKLVEVGYNDFSLSRQITSRCAGVFLWAVVVIQRLREALDDGEPAYVVTSILNSMPRDLEELFSQLVQSISPEERKQSSLLMMWVLFSKRPLSVKELGLALAFETSWRTQVEYEGSPFYVPDQNLGIYLNKRSRGLVEVKSYTSWDGTKSVVQFIHESVREFLLNHGGLRLIDPSLTENIEGLGHDALSRSCLHYIGIGELRAASFDPRALNSNDNIFAEYAYDNAFFHAQEAEKDEIPQRQVVRTFINTTGTENQCYVQWRRRYAGYYDKNKLTWSLLHACCHFGLFSCVVELLDGKLSSLQSTDGLGRALWLAAAAGHDHIVERLLRKGAHNYLDKRYRAIVYMAVSSRHNEIVRLLANNGINVNAEGALGTPLMYASLQGNEELVQVLLENNADVHHVHEKYGDALLVASVEGHAGVVQMLIDGGAKIKLCNAYADGGYARGATHALLEASGWGHNEAFTILMDTAMKAKLSVTFYETALAAAKSAGHQSIIQQLDAIVHRMSSQPRRNPFQTSQMRNLSEQNSLSSNIVIPSTSQSRREITVYVKKLNGGLIPITLRQNAKCVDLKELIRLRVGYSHDDQYLVYQMRWIPEQVYLADRGIGNESTIDVLLPIWNFRRIDR